MTLFILGLSHKTAPVEVREKVAFDSGQLPQALATLKHESGVNESMILSTCNRTELYCEIDNPVSDTPLEWLARQRQLGLSDIEPHTYRLDNEHAVRHILRVASGLDSLVVGEPQILGQLKDAYRAAVAAGTSGKLLNRLMQFSFSTAKMVRTDTEIGSTPVSVAYAAVKLARQIFGDLSPRKALLIGAGETISLVANHLHGAGIGSLVIANRSIDNARELANQHRAEAVALHDIQNVLPDADIVVASTASRVPIVTEGVVEMALRKRHAEPMFLVDLAVPRDIEASVGELDDAYLYTVDDLESVIASNIRLRQDAAAEAEQMVHVQVQDYMDWLKVQSAGDTIRAYREYGEQVRAEVSAQALARLNNGEDAEQVLRYLSTTLTNKLMHHPTTGLRKAGSDISYLGVARELLGLDKKD